MSVIVPEHVSVLDVRDPLEPHDPIDACPAMRDACAGLSVRLGGTVVGLECSSRFCHYKAELQNMPIPDAEELS